VARWVPDGEKDRMDAPFCGGGTGNVVEAVLLVEIEDVEETVGAEVAVVKVV